MSSGFNALAIAVAKFEVFATWEYSKALVVYLFELPKLGVCAFLCEGKQRGRAIVSFMCLKRLITTIPRVLQGLLFGSYSPLFFSSTASDSW